ncbi:MAG TPA: hypothetical protein VK982_03705 [Bacteroidales bacterium]|nr:hypothetical protein [Bacteroidales bacterium]
MKTKEVINQFENRWNNVYWFLRMIISNDKYVAIGKESKLLTKITSSLRLIAKDNINKDDQTILKIQFNTLRNILENRYKNARSVQNRLEKLIIDLEKEINTIADMKVFILTCESAMIPLNQAIENIPSDDKVFTESIAKSYLDIEGDKGLATVVNLWDDLGVRGCLTAERTEIVKAFSLLRIFLENDKKMSIDDQNIVLSAFTQEFERRAGQKRKKRAGGSLEDVTSFLLNYYNLNPAPAPDHFQADIEIDNWVKTKDGWLIGISCKRTLRERWKQVSSAEATILSKFKIKYIFHILTYDEDLSDEKLVTLGAHRHVFYLPDTSRRLDYAQNHVGLKNYVKPISDFIKDLQTLI